MCRFTVYLGPPVRLATILTEPSHSLIHQSFRSLERSEPLNGDGFGLAWYAPRLTAQPALFHAITPAWNHRNLGSIARVVASPCVLAHVRAASEGSEVSLPNCHPFGHGRHTFMHNGHVGGFRRVRRHLLETLGDEAFETVRGTTDTEHLFGVFVDEASRGRAESEEPGSDPAAADRMAASLSAAIRRVLALVRDFGDGEPSYLNLAVADGARAVVTRFSNDPEEGPETLYLLDGELYEPASRAFTVTRKDDDGLSVVIASERLTEDARWQAVPPNSMLVLDRWAPPRVLHMDLEGGIAPSHTAAATDARTRRVIRTEGSGGETFESVPSA